MVPYPGTPEYYKQCDGFLNYVQDAVNPVRRAKGLKEIRVAEAIECFKILNTFLRGWEESSDQAQT